MSNPAPEQLTFVLTLAVSGTGREGNDLERSRLLLESFRKFFARSGLRKLMVVARDADQAAVRAALAPYLDECRVQILPESDVCPELRDDPDTSNPWPSQNKGWYRQQLLKLAAHEYVDTPFYCTLDADVIFVKHFSVSDVIRDGRSLVNIQTASTYESLYTADTAAASVRVRRQRYEEAEAVLRQVRPMETRDRWYGETPVMLSTVLVRELAAYLERTWSTPWRELLLGKLPWTEYALYFLYAELHDRLKAFHCVGGADSVLRLSDCLWHRPSEYRSERSVGNWRLEDVFDPRREGIAVVVQSYLGGDVAEFRQRLSAYVSPDEMRP